MNNEQQNKIQKQLDSFIKLGYTLTQTDDWNIVKGKTYCYELRKGNFKIECFYSVPTSSNRRITTNFYLYLPTDGHYLSYRNYNHFNEWVNLHNEK